MCLIAWFDNMAHVEVHVFVRFLTWMFLMHVKKIMFLVRHCLSSSKKWRQFAQIWVGKAGSRGSKADLTQWAASVGYDRVRSEDHNFDGGGSIELLLALLLFHVLLQGIIDFAMLFVGFCVHDN